MMKQRRVNPNTQDGLYDASEKYGKIRKQEEKHTTRLIILSFLVLLGIAFFLLKSPADGINGIVGTRQRKATGNGKTRGSTKNTDDSENNGPVLTADLSHEGNNLDNSAKSQHKLSLSLLEEEVDRLDREVRRIKATPHIIMETDKEGMKAARKLQEATRNLILLKYGTGEGDTEHHPFRIRLDLQFQDTMPDFQEKGPNGSLLFELAPISLVPHSVYTFLEVARTFKRGAFHRNAGHVLQATVPLTNIPHLAFQEYSDQYPHKKGTVGYAGRPSGPAFYVSIQDNTKNHGPGSQQEANPYEADSIIGKVIEGFQDVAVDRIHRMPGNGFINDRKKQVIIKSMTILVPSENNGNVEYVPWQEPNLA